MDLQTFEQQALAYWQSISPRFRHGVSALVIEPGSYRKDEFEEGWVYGYCEPDEAIMLLPESPVVSRITLFYGSFVRIAELTDDFDWQAELVETIRHELQHHLEWVAGDDHLGDEDDVQDDNERRRSGQAFTPYFHRYGTALGPSVWLADHDLFIEVALPARDWRALAETGWTVTWGGIEARIAPFDPPSEGAVYVKAQVASLEEPDAAYPWDDVVLVLSRKRGWWPWSR